MIRCYLDTMAVAMPIGIDGLTLRKDRHPLYFGFLYRNIGYVDGLTSLTFDEPDAVRYLVDAFGAYSIKAVVSFSLIDDDRQRVLYQGYIDFTKYAKSETSDGVRIAVALTDHSNAVNLESKLTQLVAVPLTDSLTLPGTAIGGAGLLTTGITQVRASSRAVATIRHTVPLVRVDQKTQPMPGTFSEITDAFGPNVTYQNTIARPVTVSIQGAIHATVSASAATVAVLRAEVNGLAALELGRYAVTTVATAVTMVLNTRIVIQPGATLRLAISSTDDVVAYAFTYDATATAVSISEDELQTPTTVPAATTADVLDYLVSTLTGEALGFACRIPRGPLLTSGLTLRLGGTVLNTSLANVFAGLNALKNIYLGIEGEKVAIGLKRSLGRNWGVTKPETVLSVVESPMTERLYSSVKAGYALPTASDSDGLAGLDPNGGRVYSTGVTNLRNELDIRCAWIAASHRIEAQRRKGITSTLQVDSNKLAELDTATFVLSATKTATGWLADTSPAYNLSLSPRKNLDYWSVLLAGSLPLSLTYSDTRIDVSINGRSENEPVTADETPCPMSLTVVTIMPMDEYGALTDWIELPDGREGLLMAARWQRTSAGDTATLSIWKDFQA